VLLDREDGVRCAAGSQVPPMGQAALAAWAESAPAALEDDALIVDDVSAVDALAPLARSAELPLGSLCAAPLRFRGRRLGVLVALAHAPAGFLPHDAELLALYAAEAAIALSNAEVVDRLRRLADEDPLTGLANHRSLHARLGEELSRADRSGDPVGVVVLDLDRFARVNERHGHAEGDRVLRAVARAIRDALRPYDVAGRLAGQQFALVLPGTAPAEAERVAERVRAEVASIRLPGTTLTCSAGVAAHPADARTAPTLLEAAFDALMDAKDAGRDRTRRADPGRARTRAGRAEQAGRLRAAAADPDAVAIVFQPIADLRAGTSAASRRSRGSRRSGCGPTSRSPRRTHAASAPSSRRSPSAAPSPSPGARRARR
jgi:diguanylate cyclase (GGDEF)-like protein